MSGPPPLSGRFRAAAFGAARDLLACLRFFSRLPLPELPFEQGAGGMADLPRLAWMVPVAGAVLSAIGALALGLADGLGLPPLVCAGLAIGVLVILTGALHEDGLADLADGFGGGATRERKLEIMRDSRVGAYGATALALSLILRVAAVSALLDRSLGVAAAGLILAGAASRAASLAPLALLPPPAPTASAPGAGRLDGAPRAGRRRERPGHRPLARPWRRRPRAGGAGARPGAGGGAGGRRAGAPPDRRADRRCGGRGAANRRNRLPVRPSHRARRRLNIAT